MNLDLTATIVVSREGYISVTTERLIQADPGNERVHIFLSEKLVEGDQRLILSWETSTDLDIYALQINK